MDAEKHKEYKRNWNRAWRLKNKVESKRLNKIAYLKRRERMGADYNKYMSERIAIWRNKNPEKTKAHRLVFSALRNGTLKKTPCFCGNKEVEAHHHDYKNPLEVYWLCRKHHLEADRIRRKVINILSTPL